MTKERLDKLMEVVEEKVEKEELERIVQLWIDFFINDTQRMIDALEPFRKTSVLTQATGVLRSGSKTQAMMVGFDGGEASEGMFEEIGDFLDKVSQLIIDQLEMKYNLEKIKQEWRGLD